MRSIFLFVFLLLAAPLWAEGERFVYDDHSKRDPLWPLVNAGGSVLSYDTDFVVTDLSIEGIMLGGDGQNLAIINGRIVKVNDNVGQFIVSEITKDTVILTKGQEKFELKLKKEE